MATASIIAILGTNAQTDAYLKLRDQNKKYPRITSLTFPGNANNSHMYNSIYGHGAVIENPWLAFRIYFDNRQSIDLYAKKTPRLEIETTGFYTTEQQLAEGYGRDVLWAGKSIATGSFRGWNGEAPLTIDSVASRTQTVINQSVVEVSCKQWHVNNRSIDLVERYSVESNSRELSVEISLNGNLENLLFCTGVQKLATANSGILSPDGYAASWGTNIPDSNAPDNPATVGLAVIVDKANVAGAVETELDYLILLRPDPDGKIRYKVSATSTDETNTPFADAPTWFEHIIAEI